MAKDKKARERARQAKTMRQRTRARERKRQSAEPARVDEFQMFRDDLTPGDLDPAIWSRRQTLHDLGGLTPTEAFGEFLELVVDTEAARKGGPEGQTQMEWGIFFWKLALIEPEERAKTIEKVAMDHTDPEKRDALRDAITQIVATHEEMFPRLHAHVARLRGKPRPDLEEMAESDEEDEELKERAERVEELEQVFSAPTFIDYAQPLLEAAGEGQKALESALERAKFFWEVAEMPLDMRAAVLARERESLPPGEHEEFNRVAGMMLRRYRELFEAAEIPAPVERVATDDDAQGPAAPESSETTPSEDQPTPEASPTEAEESPRTLLGRWFRRG